MRLLDDLDLDSVLARAAQPVLDQVQIAIADTPSAMFLSDASGVLFRRVLGDTAMRRAVDAHGVLPGFSYAESDIGTNAIGSALMDGRTYQVLGEEHLWEEFQKYAAVGTPVLNPLSGRVEGAVAIAALSERMDTRMTEMVRRTAREVEQSLLDLSTARERALYRQFLESAEAGEAATPMPPELSQRDRLAMENAAVSLVAQGQEAVMEITLSDGRVATVVAQLVTGPTDLAGIAVEAWLA
ncbi:GAF domain-containing protein [Herbidospora sp. RD11066]